MGVMATCTIECSCGQVLKIADTEGASTAQVEASRQLVDWPGCTFIDVSAVERIICDKCEEDHGGTDMFREAADNSPVVDLLRETVIDAITSKPTEH